MRKLIGTLSDKESVYCSDASISRYLKSQNWNVKKASQMLKKSLKWRQEYKPEEITWVSYCLLVFTFHFSNVETKPKIVMAVFA